MINRSRKPRGAVVINGVILRWLSFEVNSNAYYQADSFVCTVPIADQPVDLDWWVSEVSMTIEIYAGYPPNPDNFRISDLDLLIKAQVDEPAISMETGLIVMTGRDFTCHFIDTKITMTNWGGVTASRMIYDLAVQHGLTPVVTKTTVPIGKYFEIEHRKLTAQSSQWDFMTWLATKERFDLYVKGDELHFKPRDTSAKNVYPIIWSNESSQCNVSTLKFVRSLSLARGVIVYVHSWNAKQKKGFTKKIEIRHNHDPLSRKTYKVGAPQIYTYVIPNLTPDQALEEARTRLAHIARHEIKVELSMPADTNLHPRNLLSVSGTKSKLDQTYYPDSIIRHFSEDDFMMDVIAKNHNVESTVNV